MTVLVVYLSVRHARPHLTLAVSIVAAAITAALAVVLIPHHGVEGAAVASAVGYVAGGILAWLLFARLARSRQRPAALRPPP